MAKFYGVVSVFGMNETRFFPIEIEDNKKPDKQFYEAATESEFDVYVDWFESADSRDNYIKGGEE